METVGVWGSGPFDSDRGLDFCDMLQQISDDAPQVVLRALQGQFGHSEQWAAVGLVQRAVFDGAGLPEDTYGVDYDGLLEGGDAEALRGKAAAACRHLAADSAWLDEWMDGGEQVSARLEQYAAGLEQ